MPEIHVPSPDQLVCFIAASDREVVRVFANELRKLNVLPLSVDAMPTASMIAPAITEFIRASTFVVAAGQDQSKNLNVAIEVGIAVGLNKPVLFFAPRHTDTPFRDVGSVFLAQVESLASSAVEPYLAAFVRLAKEMRLQAHHADFAHEADGRACRSKTTPVRSADTARNRGSTDFGASWLYGGWRTTARPAPHRSPCVGPWPTNGIWEPRGH
jgi:hypothetical protein